MVQHSGMEVADVVGRPQPVLRMLPESQKFTLADEVAERLAGPGDIAVDLGGHEGLGQCSVGEAELVRLSSGPPAVVQPSIDDEAGGPPCPGHDQAQSLHAIAVEPELV